LTPVHTNNTKLTGGSDQIGNIKPKISNNECLVSLRSIITPDNEPHMFTILFSGAMIIRSYDFFNYGVDEEFGNVMLFQLIGVPHINQKAVEVPVVWSSLSTTGLYVLLADDNIFFWIGTSYYAKYSTTEFLTSDDMIKKLNYVYEEEASQIVPNEKEIHYILQGIESELFIRILTKEGEMPIDMPDFESKLIYQDLIIPKLPRCFCLSENGIAPEYTEALFDESRHKVENENLVFKEFLNFDQLTLLQKGIYMFTLSSDVFIWIGSLVNSLDLFNTLIGLHTKISAD